jgi:RHS repeat-associated protein
VGQVHYIRDGALAPVQVGYGPGSSEPRHDVHVDHLDTPRPLSDTSEAASWRTNYEGFGGFQIDPASTVEMNVSFPGQYFDEESGIHDNLHRYYDPAVGRYVSADPIGQLGLIPVRTNPAGR